MTPTSVNPNTKSVRNRRKKRQAIFARLSELRDEPASARMRLMNTEFGPYWYLLLVFDEKIPDELKQTPRYIAWTQTTDQAGGKK